MPPSASGGLRPRRLPPVPGISDVLRLFGLKAQKRLSQNFLLAPSALDKFAKTAGEVYSPKDGLVGKTVVEVGPGPGGITRSLLARGAKEVHVIEKDERFLPPLRMLQEASAGAVKINIGDVLKFNMSKLFPDIEVPPWEDRELPNLTLVGNLPFNISTPLLIRLLKDMQERRNLYAYGRVPLLLTFQHEVAHRMGAIPGDPERSRLSFFCQNYAQIRYKYRISGATFVPAPAVDVGVVSMIPLKRPYIDVPFQLLEKVVTTVMHGKNKTLRVTVGNLYPDGYFRTKLSRELFAMTGLKSDEKPPRLTMDDMANICYAYQHHCEQHPSIRTYTSQFAKETRERIQLQDGIAERKRREEEANRGGAFYYDDADDEEAADSYDSKA